MAISDSFNATATISRGTVTGTGGGGQVTTTAATVASGVSCRIEHAIGGGSLAGIGQQVSVSNNLEAYDYVGYFASGQDVQKDDVVTVASGAGPIPITATVEKNALATDGTGTVNHVEAYMKDVV